MSKRRARPAERRELPRSHGLHPENRFPKMLRRGEPSDHRPDLGPCLIFVGADNGNGYGQFHWGGKNGYAHRYAWERVHGPIPEGMTVDHLCRVRKCCEITHLELVEGLVNHRRGVTAREHCRKGHSYKDGNVIYTTNGRYCRICRKETIRRNGRKAREKKKRERQTTPRTKKPSTVRYNQELVREQVRLIRSAQTSVAAAARLIGCSPQTLSERTWRETRLDVLARDLRCTCCGGSDDLDAHHRIPRGMGGNARAEITYGMANLAALCRSCHGLVHNRVRWAYRNGFLCPSYEDPEHWPVLRHAERWEQPTASGWEPATPAEGQLDIPDLETPA